MTKENKNLRKNLIQNVIPDLIGYPAGNRALYTPGSSGRADACPRMTGCDESGRSMVEMLGVLAIIGILSVAGIAGYSNAMNRHKANTLINEAQKRAVIASGQIQMTGKAPNLGEFKNNNFGYGEFGTDVITKSNLNSMPEGQFGIKVSGVPQSICKNILNTIGDNTVIRRLSTIEAPTTAITACGDDNTLLMVYNNDMSTHHVPGEFGYEDCPESFYQCATTNSCVASENNCPSICELEQPLSSGCVCPEHRDTTDGKCGECVDVETYQPWTQPVLTSNGTMGGSDSFATQSSSEMDNNRKAWRAFDGSNNDAEEDCWHAATLDIPNWLSWYTSKAIKIHSITITNRPATGISISDGAVPRNFEIQYSDDFSNWTAVYTGVNQQGGLLSTSFPVNATSAHKYWRIYIYNNHVYDSISTHPVNQSFTSIGELTINADELTSVTDYELDSSGQCVVTGG